MPNPAPEMSQVAAGPVDRSDNCLVTAASDEIFTVHELTDDFRRRGHDVSLCEVTLHRFPGEGTEHPVEASAAEDKSQLVL